MKDENVKKQLRELLEQTEKLRKLIESEDADENAASENAPPEQIGHIYKMKNMHKDPSVMAILDRMENDAGAKAESGEITYIGVFSSGGRQSTWVRNGVNTDSLLALIENSTTERTLACIGSRDRLNLLLALLKKPQTVAQLVGECGFGSTGQVYHHLNPLIAADLVAEDRENEGKGVYVVKPHRVGGIIMLLAAVYDLTDNEYSQSSLAGRD